MYVAPLPIHFLVYVLIEFSQVSPLTLFQNPMILLGVVAMGVMFGMPKIMENSMFPPLFLPLSIT